MSKIKKKTTNRLIAIVLTIAMLIFMVPLQDVMADDGNSLIFGSPVITVKYDNNSVKNSSYFNATRTVTISVTDKANLFDAENTVITVTAKDADGNAVKDENGKIVDFNNMIKIMDSDSNELGEDSYEITVNSSKTTGVIVVSGWSVTANARSGRDTHTIKIKYQADANYSFSIEAKDKAGGICSSEDIVYAAGTKAGSKFTIDTEAPAGTITIESSKWSTLRDTIRWNLFGGGTVSVYADAVDRTSPISVDYYVTAKTQNVLTEAQLDGLSESAWNNAGNPFDSQASVKLFDQSNDEQLEIYMRIMDYAGNITYVNCDGYIVDKTAPVITLTPETPDVSGSDNGIYGYYNSGNGDTVSVKASVSDVSDGNSYSGLKTVTWWVECDGKRTQGGTWVNYTDDAAELSDLISKINKTIRVDTSVNNSSDVEVFVKAVDNAGNSTTKSVKLDIDVTVPTIAISYDNNSVKNGSYFNSTRTATIVITERTGHFDPDDVSITITAVDADGNAVSGAVISKMISSWETAEGENADEAKHTATITYLRDANYTFSISYTDMAGNKADYVDTGGSVAPYKFTIDTTNPTGVVTYTAAEGNTDTSSSLIKKLTFGFYSASRITVSCASDDATSPIESVKYYKAAGTTAMTKRELNALDDDSWKTFRGVSFTSDEKFVIYVKITDMAGNYTYISTDGLIIDSACSIAETLSPEITMTQPVNDIYSGDVTVDVSITDPVKGGTYSGLHSVTYEVYSMGELTQTGTLYKSLDENYSQDEPVRTVSGTITVLSGMNNSNDVEVIVYASDNAGNSSQESVSCRIDTTAPVITVSYDNNAPDSSNDSYFNENRTATVTITERNFDEDDVVITITNTDGIIPDISGWTKISGSGNEDDTKWITVVTYSADGDYTFDIEYADKAGLKAGAVNYAAATVAGGAFTIDKTDPVISIEYDNNDVSNGNYYKSPRTAVITINEHNFNPDDVLITLKKDSKTVQVSPVWSRSGDVYSTTVTFGEEAFYILDIDFTDMAGNVASDYPQDCFHIDLGSPEIAINGVANEAAYNQDQVIPVIAVTDANYNSAEVIITLEGLRYGCEYSCMAENITEGQVFTFENIDTDDIYVLTVSAMDSAGNSINETVRFSVNRDGSTYDISSLEAINGIQLQTSDMGDLVIYEVNPNELSDITVTLYKNNETIILEEGVDYTCDERVGENGWHYYTYIIFKNTFTDDGSYNIRISSVDKAGNSSANSLDTKASDIEMFIDNTSPTIIMTNLESHETYVTECYEAVMVVNDNMTISNITVILDGREIVFWTGDELEAITDQNGEFTFAIEEESYARTVTIKAVDAAGNEESVTIDKFYVTTDRWVRFYTNIPLFAGTVGGVALLVCVTTVLILMRKIRRKKNAGIE